MPCRFLTPAHLPSEVPTSRHHDNASSTWQAAEAPTPRGPKAFGTKLKGRVARGALRAMLSPKAARQATTRPRLGRPRVGPQRTLRMGELSRARPSGRHEGRAAPPLPFARRAAIRNRAHNYHIFPPPRTRYCCEYFFTIDAADGECYYSTTCGDTFDVPHNWSLS